LAWANAWEVWENTGEWDWMSGTANDTNLHESVMSFVGQASLIATQHVSSTSIKMDYSVSHLVFVQLATIRVNSRSSRFIHS
jgi:ribosomal protein S26